jgi:peptidoglycan/LPS O-acetylase OafA/YrhL
MSNGRRESLDGLRGYAALAVAFYHGILHFDTSVIERVLYRPLSYIDWADMPTKLLLIPFNGEAAVIAFFILSGLVLRGALDRMSARPFRTAALDFSWRRLWRIYPAVVACMSLFFLLSVATAPRGGWPGFTTFPHFLPIHFLWNVTLYSTLMHGPSWSVQVELCAVPFLLAAEGLRRVLGPLGLVVALFYGMVAIEHPVLVAWLPSLWPYLFMFFIGMLIGEPPVAAAAARLHPATWAIALAMFLVGRHITERAAVSGLIAQGFAGGLLVACVAYRNDALAAFLERPVSLFLGRISYSFYLLNVIALYTVWAVIEAWVPSPTHHPLGWGLVSAVASVLLTLPAASISERYIEQPGIAVGRWLTRSRGAARPRESLAKSAPSGDPPSGDRFPGDRPPGDQSLGDQSLGDQPLGDQPLGDHPLGDRFMAENPRLRDSGLATSPLGSPRVTDDLAARPARSNA